MREMDAIPVVQASVVSYGDICRESYVYANACIIQFLIFNQNILAIHKYYLTCPIRNSTGFDIQPVINRFSIHRVAFVYPMGVIAQ
jgi:hypothetical protein